MWVSKFCERETTETWTGSWCSTCRKMKNLGNVYGFEELYGICERVCVRNETQINNKINLEKENEYVKNKDGKWVKDKILSK